MNCSRCDVPQELQKWHAASEDECWYCPCCRSRLRTIEQLEATAQRRMAELGMNEEQYAEHCQSFMNTEPLDDTALKGLQAMADRRETEWKPACEHDTNPYVKQEPFTLEAS